MTSVQHLELLESLVESLRDWIKINNDIDLSSGISLRRTAIEQGQPPFGELKGQTAQLRKWLALEPGYAR